MVDASAQFRGPSSVPEPYMGGVSYGCGDHPSLPSRHRWSRVRVMGPLRDRICLDCSVTKGADE